jgi:outer membrane protein assembly factor BamB
MRRFAAIGFACLTFTAFAARAADPGAQSYQVTPAHNAVVSFSPSWGPNLKVVWTAALDGPAAYPLVANGYVYALVSGSPDEVVAIDATTGATVWKESAGSNGSVGLTYDEGRLFTVNSGGTLSAYSAKKGKLDWTVQLPDQYSFSSPPSALSGIVYNDGAGDGGTLYANDEKTGKLLWTQSVENGDDSSPAVTSTGVYVSYPCQYYDFAPKTGSVIWHYAGGCDGGGGATVVVAAGLAFVRDPYGAGSNTIFDAGTGKAVGSFAATQPPVIASKKLGYFLDGQTLSAVAPKTNKLFWEFTGDGNLQSPPIAVNDYVVAASASGNVYVLDGATGAVASTTKLGGAATT